MSCSLFYDYSAGANAGDIFYYNTDNSCLGIPSYVNGTDCSAWPLAGNNPNATFIWRPYGTATATPITSECLPPLYTSQNYGVPIYTTLPCAVSNSIFTETGIATYKYTTDGSGGMSSIVWTIGPIPSQNTSTTSASTLQVPSYIFNTSTVVITDTIYSTASGTLVSTTTLITTATTITSTITRVTALTTVAERDIFAERDFDCTAKGPAGEYDRFGNARRLTRTFTFYDGTNTYLTTLAPLSYVASSGTTTVYSNTTTTEIDSRTAYKTATAGLISTITAPATASATFGPYYVTVSGAGTTYTGPDDKRSLPTDTPKKVKRQELTDGYVGLADSDGTVGIVTDPASAIIFYVINGQLLALIDDTDWYTYTELAIVGDPGYESWVLQASPPATDSISTEWTGFELGSLGWQNDAFGTEGFAQMCAGSSLSTSPDIPVINFWYDESLDPPGGACVLLSAGVVDVPAIPSSTEIFTEMTTITSISTITGDPITTYVCNNGGVCPQQCTYDTNLLTTSICSTASNGLSTCQACLMSTPAPVIQTDVEWVTSTIPCANPPCPQVVTQWNNAGGNTPCNGNDNTVTVWGNAGAGGAGGAAAAPAAPAAPATDAGAGAGTANTYVATDSGSSTSTSTTKSTTRTGTPTANPSVGFGGKVEAQSGSVMALAFVAGAFAFFA
ncbi:hypothetical protein H072_8162 [Dactylellina haptotyla CBS 200.50]|uniref:Uncharacterized protein n=1 Tax=Dactylellina haptotyla (strain CBS 200.50) TaxID=1284197 RepID=S8BSB2_DACHA|nr:hypothetical protein H072_8162 [Dactylellina haptotyla CBS 200.50]